ncbi:hypothetical protein [Pseudomonas phage COT4]|uniref:Uncharacterized protein n=1 Tax=Pseudomonas phage M5.1 TaxID=2873460 RepID=A0AAE8XDZ4_9CAUD|nr:hypothetical protein QGX13_gp041 [Pseudomonas phage M5.1]UAV89642.1 hypothetical protein M51_41 [Pseudomonas phage M5.1]UGL61241.1 hypothetical protein [Pseudomonas phage COT4]
MKLLDLIAKATELHKEYGNLQVVFGDCNKMHKADGLESVIIEDLSEYYLNEVHPDDNEQRCEEDQLQTNAVLVY